MSTQAFAPVLAALTVMQSNVNNSQKAEAHKYLESFQKSKEAWTATLGLLATPDATVEAKLFAATTVKGKITYDLDQLPREQLFGLRDTLLNLLSTYRDGPRPIRTQLCVCLANLAIQLTEWKDVLQLVWSTLGGSAGDCVLEFLQVLPEEVTEGRKINLSEEDLISRSKELLEDNADQVLQLLIRYSEISASASTNPHLIECITSWLREIPVARIVTSSLLQTIINALSNEASFEQAVECITTLYRDTTDVDESMDVIKVLYPRVLALRPKIKEAADARDLDKFKGITKLFAEAGEAWVVLVARLPDQFRGLVEAVLECCAGDTDREAVSITFYFWNDLKQIITKDKYLPARNEYLEIFSQLVDVMIRHLEFPTSDRPDETDLFDGDREQEEKFREFRHHMGDVLKDCCEVISVLTCLGKAFDLINTWIRTYASLATATSVPHWQKLEAPLFAMRAMGRMVPRDESAILRQVIPLIVQIPNHEKLRFQAVMALGRYTEWTAEHPDFLQPQIGYIVSSFDHTSQEVMQAAALAFRFFGSDCAKLLQHEVVNLHGFYDSVLEKLPASSQEEISEGVACVVAVQDKNEIYRALKLYCDPLMERLKVRAKKAQESPNDKELQKQVADTLQLLTIFVTNVQPYYQPGETNQAVTYCQEILPILAVVGNTFTDSTIILEKLCKCWRYMVLSYRTAVLPLLPSLAQQLSSGFETTRHGCFLWATDAVLREFATGAEFVNPQTSQEIYAFFEQQAFAFLRIMNDSPPGDLPDVIEDFYRLLIDALIYYHNQFIPAAICSPILTASQSALSLQQDGPLIATLHFLRDLLSYGTDNPNSSAITDPYDGPSDPPNTPKNIETIKQLVSSQGEALVQRVLTGMMFTFPSDCLQDASGVLLALFELAPQQTAQWIKGTIVMLPPGSVKPGEGERLIAAVGEKMQTGQMRKIRTLLQDFTTSYRRRNVAPREGLGRLESTRFTFNG